MPKPRVFAPVAAGGDWRRNAVVEHQDDHVLAMGFSETADLIVDHWVTRGPNDLLFAPLVFNHRHALELVLKAAIRAAAACLRADGHVDRSTDRAKVEAWLTQDAGHNLHKLADRADILLRRLDLESLPVETHGVLVSIHELDPSGETFRYAKVKGPAGELLPAPRPLLSGPNDLQAHVDVVAMHEHFRGAFNLLSYGVMTVLDNVADMQADMQADMDYWRSD